MPFDVGRLGSEKGKYLDDWDVTQGVSCLDCDVGKTSTAGAADCDRCLGYEDVIIDGDDGLGLGYVRVGDDCVQCAGDLKGLDCRSAGSVLQTAPLRTGYWRTSEESVKVLPCSEDEFCPGGNNSETMCRDGHGGPYCQVVRGAREKRPPQILFMHTC